jgi:outer membrane protein assembly factor BamB
MRATSELDGTTEFMVQSLDAKTGRELWSNDLKSASEVSYGLGDIAGGVVELVTYARENQAAYGGEDGTAYTSLTSHFLDVKTGKERFSFGKCDPRTPGVGAMDGQMVISLEPLITRQGSGTIDDTGRPRPCSHFGAAQVRSLATGNVTGALSEKVLPIEYAPLQTVFGSGKNLVLSVGGQIRAMTPNGVQVWARDASAAQVLDADEEHVVALVRQTHKVVVLDARTGKSVSTIPDVQDDIEIAVLAGPHQFVLAGDSGSSLYSL